MAIVNASGWPMTKMITVINKTEFLEGLINQEVVVKRDLQISAFGKGLEQLGVLSLIRKHPDVLKAAFVCSTTTQKSISAEDFLNLVSSGPPTNGHDHELKAYEWFITFIKSKDTQGNDNVMILCMRVCVCVCIALFNAYSCKTVSNCYAIVGMCKWLNANLFSS